MEGMPRAAPPQKILRFSNQIRWSAGHLEAVCAAIASFNVLS